MHHHHLHRHHQPPHNSSRMELRVDRTLFFASLFILFICAGPQLSLAQSLYQSFQKLKIPDLIPVSYSTDTIRVELNGNIVKPGDPIPARSFRNLDIMKGVHWEPDYDSKYTLMLLDLDRRPNQNGTLNIYNQYTSLNIPGNQIVNGQAIVAFDPPNVPCQPSTKHRLVMLAFHQDQNFDLADVAYISAPAGYSSRRENFRLDDFIQRHRLHLAAANVFLAIGEVNGVCSAGSTLQPSYLVTVFTLVMIMVHLVSFRHRQPSS